MKKNVINFVNILEDTYNKVIIKNYKYIHNQKYSTKDYINKILNFIKNSTYWTKYKGKINGKLLNSKHNEFVKNDTIVWHTKNY